MYVDENSIMHPVNDKRRLTVIFQNQQSINNTICVIFDGLIELILNPNDINYDDVYGLRDEAREKLDKIEDIRGDKLNIEWGSQIRSYVFDDRRVKDHRTGYQTSDVNGVMDGKIDGFVKAYLMEFADKGE